MGERIHVDHPPPAVNALEGGNGPPGEAELAVVVVLHDHAVPLLRPAEEGMAPGNGGDDARRVMVGGGEVGRRGPGGVQGLQGYALAVQGNGAAGRAPLPVDLANLRVARVLQGEDGFLPAQQLGQEQVQILRPRAHDNLLRGYGHALKIPQVPGDGLPQGGEPLGGNRGQVLPLGEDLPGEPCPEGGGNRSGPGTAPLWRWQRSFHIGYPGNRFAGPPIKPWSAVSIPKS